MRRAHTRRAACFEIDRHAAAFRKAHRHFVSRAGVAGERRLAQMRAADRGRQLLRRAAGFAGGNTGDGGAG